MGKEHSEGGAGVFLIEESDQGCEVKNVWPAQGRSEVRQTVPRGDLRATRYGLGDSFHDVRPSRIWLRQDGKQPFGLVEVYSDRHRAFHNYAALF